MNGKLLRSIMVLHGDTNASLAEYLGITEQSVSNKINENGTEFKQGEIFKIKAKYNLDSDMVDRIFFCRLSVYFRHTMKGESNNAKNAARKKTA